MRFTGLLGSPNATGRTRLVADAIASGIVKAAGQVEMLSVAGEVITDAGGQI
jgi:multimeric flavodoxin WrbA